MDANPSKSKRQSGGSGPSSSQQPDELVLYLDENLCNAKAILDTLTQLNIRFEKHLDHFPWFTRRRLASASRPEWLGAANC